MLVEITDEWDVPLMVCRGYPSMSFLHTGACIYYFGDHDPSGVDIDRAVFDGICSAARFSSTEAMNVMGGFERVAVTEDQVEQWDLPTRPTKKTDTRSKSFKGESVELDAIPAARLRDVASDCIEQHADPHQLDVLQRTEAEERRLLLEMAETFNGGGA